MESVHIGVISVRPRINAAAENRASKTVPIYARGKWIGGSEPGQGQQNQA